MVKVIFIIIKGCGIKNKVVIVNEIIVMVFCLDICEVNNLEYGLEFVLILLRFVLCFIIKVVFWVLFKLW